MIIDILEYSLAVLGKVVVVTLGHQLEARLEEGSPGEVSGGLRLAHLVAETLGQLD